MAVVEEVGHLGRGKGTTVPVQAEGSACSGSMDGMLETAREDEALLLWLE